MSGGVDAFPSIDTLYDGYKVFIIMFSFRNFFSYRGLVKCWYSTSSRYFAY